MAIYWSLTAVPFVSFETHLQFLFSFTCIFVSFYFDVTYVSMKHKPLIIPHTHSIYVHVLIHVYLCLEKKSMKLYILWEIYLFYYSVFMRISEANIALKKLTIWHIKSMIWYTLNGKRSIYFRSGRFFWIWTFKYTQNILIYVFRRILQNQNSDTSLV